MLGSLFNIGNAKTEFQPVQAPIQVKKQRTPSIKKDALKIIEKVLGDLENVNNPKVDGLRRLYMSLNSDTNLESVVAFYKEPIAIKKRKSKKLISGATYK